MTEEKRLSNEASSLAESYHCAYKSSQLSRKYDAAFCMMWDTLVTGLLMFINPQLHRRIDQRWVQFSCEIAVRYDR